MGDKRGACQVQQGGVLFKCGDVRAGGRQHGPEDQRHAQHRATAGDEEAPADRLAPQQPGGDDGKEDANDRDDDQELH